MSRYKQPYSLYKRGKYWYYKTYTPDGVRTAGKSTGCTSKNSAREYCDRLYKDDALWTYDETYEHYSKDFFATDSIYFRDRTKPVSPQTIVQYQSIQKNHLLPYFGKIKMGDINYTKVKAFRFYLQNEKKLSDKSITLILTELKIVISYAYRDRLILTNPFDFIKPPKAETIQKRDAFTLDEIKTIYTKIDDKYKNQVLLMTLTGMRIKESLIQSDDDILQGDGFEYLYVQYQRYRKNQKLPVKRNSIREIPIIPEIKSLLYFFTKLEDFYTAFNEIKNTFENVDDRKLSFHSLRHFFITNSKASGVLPIKIEYMAGHSLKGQEGVYTNFKGADCLEILDWQRKVYDYITKKES